MVRAEVPSTALGPAGIGKLIAQSSADTQRSAASSEIEVMRVERSAIALRARIDEAREQLLLDGTLRAGTHGLGDEAVGVFDGTQHIVTLRTGSDGAFTYSGALPKHASTSARVLRLQARFDNDAPWITASRSNVIELKLPDTSAPSVLWLFAPLAACAIGLWLLSRREIEARRHSVAPAERGAGVHLGPRGARGHVGAHRIAGSVRDAHGHGPIPGAVLVLHAPGGERSEIRSGEDGRFASGDLAPGSYVLQVEALGYVTSRERAACPASGRVVGRTGIADERARRSGCGVPAGRRTRAPRARLVGAMDRARDIGKCDACGTRTCVVRATDRTCRTRRLREITAERE